MSFGLRTWSEKGVLEMDTDSFTYQVIHSQTYTLADKATIVVSLPEFTPASCTAAILPIGPPAEAGDPVGVTKAAPYVRVSQGKIEIFAVNPTSSASRKTQIEFRLLVMRYKL